MMNELGLRRVLPEQSSGSGHSFGTPRHPSIIDPILSKRVCFYKSGDPQFSGLRMVINNRTFKTFDALLDSLSKKVPLPFGVRNITTPRGVHAIYTLDELEDGKSYICSDSRKVKPINLAVARKKLPPWYHARPVSSRRRTVQKARFFPGQNLHKKEPVVMRTPKRLTVFRNGDPNFRHIVLLNKRTSPTFESILEYISEVIQFHVVKLHTADGRRVDGLPGLILCSGVVVAAGREPFRPANYNAQKSPEPPVQPANRVSLRRIKAFNGKKKSLFFASKPRTFSPSSERYIVNRIHDSIAESSCDLPSNLTNSVDLESGCMLESVAETDGETCLEDGHGGQDSMLPSEDDIEKSFRVNQDGSMTVEMRVRLTIKEEETVHWTTTLSRSSVASQLNAACLPEAEEEISSLKSNSLDIQSPAASIDTINKDKTKDNNDEDPPSLGSGASSESGNEEDNVKVQTDVMSPKRVLTPGRKHIREKQASMESIKSVTAEGIQEGMIGSYSYREQTEHGAMTEQYCMVKQSSTKPVPKPRRLGSVDAININSRNVSTFKSAEILQIESSGEEVTETVLHIYEQQTCQDNFLANNCGQSMSFGIPFCRPATAGSGQLSCNNDIESEFLRPSTASESISIWRAGSMSVTSDLTLPSLNTGAVQAKNSQQQFPKPTKDRVKPQQSKANNDKRGSSKPKVINKRARRLMSPVKRQKEKSVEATDKRKKVKTFSSAAFIKKIYGNKSKSGKSMMKLKMGPTRNEDGGVTTKSSQHTNDTTCTLKDIDVRSALEENVSETPSLEKNGLNLAPNEISQPRGILTRQTSMHQERDNENESYDVSKSMSLPAYNSSSSVTNEYVENWLEKSNLNPGAYENEESKKVEAVTLGQTETGRCGESENQTGLMKVAERVKCLEEASDMQTCQTLKTDLPHEIVRRASVKQRIKSFENKLANQPVDKTSQPVIHSQTTNESTENCSRLTRINADETKPFPHNYCPEIIPPSDETSTETPSGSEVENESASIKISLLQAESSSALSVDLPFPPPPAELSNAEYCMMDVPSAASSPLYRLSSASSQMSDNHPLSISPTSDNAISPTDRTMEITTSIQTDIPSTLKEAPLPRTQSIKRSPLVSNLSFDRKMSLRKASLDKYTLCSDAPSETNTSSTTINIVGDYVLPNGICPTGTERPSENPPEATQQSNNILDLKNSPSCCTSASPTSLTSEERVSSDSILSSEAPPPSEPPLKETKTNKTQLSTQKEMASPKPLLKKVKLLSSPSPDRKNQTKKASYDLPQNSPKLSSTHNPPDKTVSPNIPRRKHTAPSDSPSAERKQMLIRPNLQKRSSPYSQSLDMASPPVKQKSSRKSLSRDLSLDNASVSRKKPQRRTSLERKRQTPQSIKSTTDLDRTCNTQTPLEVDQVNKKDDLITERSVAETQTMPQPLNITKQPNMKPVLEEICYSIKSIRQITQKKRPSCLEKSNSLPDFSSHVASTFGSSSKALLAFLSVMTLKEGIANQNMDELNANNVSCAEALKMIDSLREIASIEDSQKLKVSLSHLQQSASKQLLQSWRGFQELGEKCKSRSSTPNDSEQEIITEASLGLYENVIDEIMDNLGVPEELKEELASLSVSSKIDSDDEVYVRDGSQDEKVNVDVSAIIKKFTDVDQPKQSSTDSLTESVKHKPTDQASKDKDSKYPPAEANDEQIHEERKPGRTVLFVEESEEGMQSSRDAESQENQEQQGPDADKSNQEKDNMTGVVSGKGGLEEDSCTSEVEEEEVMEDNQPQMHLEDSESMAVNELAYEEESGSEEEGQNIAIASKDSEQKVSLERSESSSDAGGQHSSEEEPQVECEEIQKESRESDNSSNPESHSEEEEDKQPSSDHYVELSVREKEGISRPDSQNKSLSEEEQSDTEEEQPGVEEELSNEDALSVPASDSEKEQQSQVGSPGLNVSVDESISNSDVDEPSSEEEQPDVVQKQLKVIIEECLSGNEEEQESIEEEEHTDSIPNQAQRYKGLNALIEEADEDRVSSDDEDHHADETRQNAIEVGSLIEDQDSFTKNDKSHLMKSDSLAKHSRHSADRDSGNDYSSCEEHVEVEQTIKDEQISSSIEELSFYEKESCSEEEHANVDRFIEESCTASQEAFTLASQSEVNKCEMPVEKVKHPSEEISQSIAERVCLLEKQVAETHKRKNTAERSPVRRLSQRNAPPESDGEDSTPEVPTSESRSAPQSSLSFSYDSSGVITTEPEGSRVRSIREMFLAKSATDIQHRRQRLPSPNRAERSELRAETSASGGYQSQTSSDQSSGEDDSARKSITKGFVRRTIERLYGKKDANPDEEAGERPPSAPKQGKKEHSSIFSPFHTARAKAISELSYFNSTNAMDTLTEATRCIAFNAQVGPGDSVPIDSGRWLLRENTTIRKSVSDPVGINKTLTNSPHDEETYEDTEDNTPYSLFSTKSEQEDKKSLSRKCTYFSLPHASDSDACPDDLSTASKSSMNGDSVVDIKDSSEDTKTWAERNGTLPGVGVTDFKIKDNKVHPLVELPPDGEVVVAQPVRGQGVVPRRLHEPDMLDILYDFCGQNCPIL